MVTSVSEKLTASIEIKAISLATHVTVSMLYYLRVEAEGP
jgi:hypothetical protein